MVSTTGSPSRAARSVVQGMTSTAWCNHKYSTTHCTCTDQYTVGKVHHHGVAVTSLQGAAGCHGILVLSGDGGAGTRFGHHDAAVLGNHDVILLPGLDWPW